MSPYRKNELEELKKQFICPQHFACAGPLFMDLCVSANNPELNSLDCLECASAQCAFKRKSEKQLTCDCPLRNYIFNNFTSFAFDIADIIKRKNCSSGTRGKESPE